jgi:hypothetical protein
MERMTFSLRSKGEIFTLKCHNLGRADMRRLQAVPRIETNNSG